MNSCILSRSHSSIIRKCTWSRGQFIIHSIRFQVIVHYFTFESIYKHIYFIHDFKMHFIQMSLNYALFSSLSFVSFAFIYFFQCFNNNKVLKRLLLLFDELQSIYLSPQIAWMQWFPSKWECNQLTICFEAISLKVTWIYLSYKYRRKCYGMITNEIIQW